MHLLLKTLAFLALALSLSASDPPAPDPTTAAKEIIAKLAAHDFNAVVARFDGPMRAALPADKLSAVWDSLIGNVGPFQRITHATVTGQQGLQVIVLTCEFQQAALDAKIVFDPQGRVAGLFFTPAAPPPAAPAPWSAPTYADPSKFHERDVTVATGPWHLPGTLTLPNGNGPFPAVVLVHGSGPQDQDETIGPNKPFKDLAWGLASQNIAVLRYVKRTKQYGARSASTPAFTVNDETIDDALAAVSLLATSPAIDHAHIYVLGHSLGGMLAPRIAAASPQIAGIIIAAGTARPLQQVIVAQLKYLAHLQGKPSEESKKQIAAAERAQAEIESPSLQPGATIDLLGALIPGSYFLDLRSYHPAQAAANLKIPTLVLQGGHDYQVTREDFELWQSALAQDPRATLKFYPPLTHLFMPATTSGPASPADYNVPGHVSKEVIDHLAHWIDAHRATPSPLSTSPDPIRRIH